jgi:SAM-dependent methyltransferase
MRSTQELLWNEIWNKKGETEHDCGRIDSIWQLVQLNGYDSGTDDIDFLHWQRWIEEIKQSIPQYCAVSTWLDAGCGAGAFLFSQDARINISGFDYSGPLIGLAGAYAEVTGRAARFFVGDLADECLDVESYDVISCVSSLQYIPEVKGLKVFEYFLKRANRGMLVAENPCKDAKAESMRFRSARLSYSGDEYVHTYYSRHDFNEIAADMGFRSLEVSARLGAQSSHRWTTYYERLS